MHYYLTFVLLFTFTYAVDWHTCDSRTFCSKVRNKQFGESNFYLTDSAIFYRTSVQQDLVNVETGRVFSFILTFLDDNTFRIAVTDPNNDRHSAAEALNGELNTVNATLFNYTSGSWSATIDETTVNVNFNPLKIEFIRNEEVVVALNSKQRFTYNTEEDDEAIALDITFYGAERAYGIPEHAERLSLKTTGPGGLNPYRLYNVDYYAYGLETQEALYGAIPVLYGHGTNKTSGIFWLNSAQTFVDINNGDGQVDALFISESGILDLFVFTGPTLAAATKQYTKLTGTAPLPQYFALGYHQSRYSYMSQEDVETVIKEFDNHDFPMDVIWLDIDYADGYKYFTWNYSAFPDPVQMQNNIASSGRKLVAIIDPHYKVEVGYHVYDQMIENNFYVKESNGGVFEGNCWPGLSVYCDYFNPDAFEWYSNLFQLSNFVNSTDNMYIWNDMNEPSVFDVEEQTMDGELLHYGGWNHRDLHNMYGYKQTQATHHGLLKRNANKRPFILTRSHFAGSQRYAAMWTGDNVASWEHFRISVPMLLTQSLAGFSFCGADVGGFINNVEDDLLQRWYQAGSWYPFFRGHSSNDVDRREPYLYSEDIQQRIRTALRQRYVHLPVWYTLWFEHERYGEPVMRPLSYHFSKDAATLDIDNQWLIGSNILICPVFEKEVNEITTYLPGGLGELWYDINNNLMYLGTGNITINVDMDSVPVFYRGGSIIFRKDTPRTSSQYMKDDGYTVYIFTDINGEATGNIYIDDYESLNYKNKQYVYENATYKNNELVFTKIDEDSDYPITFNIETIYLYRPPTIFKVLERSTFKCDILKQNVQLNIDVNQSLKLTLL